MVKNAVKKNEIARRGHRARTARARARDGERTSDTSRAQTVADEHAFAASAYGPSLTCRLSPDTNSNPGLVRVQAHTTAQQSTRGQSIDQYFLH